MTISFSDFQKVELRVGRVERVEPLDGAVKPAYKLWIDFGDDFGVKQSSAQITSLYEPEELEGRLVVAVTNFPPKRIAGFRSEVLVLGVPTDAGDVTLLAPDDEVPLGTRVF